MSLGTLALIGICGLCGPLLSAGARGAIPVVVGEILAGVVIGHAGFNAIDTSNPTLTFLADIGFAMLMFNAGLNVPLRDERVRSSLGRGTLTAGIVTILAVAAGLLVSRIGATGHPAIYTVLIASGSAAVVLFGLSWIAERTGASLLIAGFGAGLMVAALGGPKRLSTEVLGVAGGLFVPLFFVVLGARVNLRGLAQDPAMIGLALALVGLTAGIHVFVARVTRQPAAAGLLASAQLGVPAAIVALGLPEHVITSTQGAAIITASMISLAVCSVGAAALTPRAQKPSQPPADVRTTQAPAPSPDPAAAAGPT
jgi:Kef-type K+ transport system membrane component KefB